MREKAYPYWVDGEVGRFEFPTHQIVEDDVLQYDTASDFFPSRGRWEWYQTSGFKELAFLYGVTEESYRHTSRRLNRLRHQSDRDGTPSRTLQAQAEREGTRLQHALDQKATEILNAAQVSEQDGTVIVPSLSPVSQPLTMPQDLVNEAIETCQSALKAPTDLRSNPMPYEAPEVTVNITVDDVNVKRQKATRGSPGPASAALPRKTRKYAHTTVVHIEQMGQRSVLAGQGMVAVFRLVMAVLVSNGLEGFHLQFFTDGYGILHDAIRRSFSWCPTLVIVLDWYHLLKKCQLQLSLACDGRDHRNAVLKELLPLLWQGQLDKAITFIQTLSAQHIKNAEALTKLVGYLERNRAHIPCYAVRKSLGLRNSSQIGEKLNDLLVSDRQKHRGMSWSTSGSVSLAVLAALKRNGEHAQWFDEGEIDFKLVA